MATLDKVWFKNTSAIRTNFVGVKMRKAKIESSQFMYAWFSGSVLNRIENSDLSNTNITHSDLSFSVIQNADLSGSKWFNVLLTESTLSGSKFSNATVNSCNLSFATMTGVKASKLQIGHSSLTCALLEKSTINQVKIENSSMIAVSGLDMSISDSIIHECDLTKANVSGLFLNLKIRESRLAGLKAGALMLRGVSLSNCYLVGLKTSESALSDISAEEIQLISCQTL